MPKLVFSSDHLPEHLDDQARFRLWCDTFGARIGASETSRAEDVPFFSVFEFVQFGQVSVAQHRTTLTYWERTPKQVAADARDDLLIGFNRSATPPMLSQRGRELVLGRQDLALFSHSEPMQARAARDMALVGVDVPRARLLERVPHAEDLVMAPLDVTSPAMQHLQRYLDFLLTADAAADDPALAAHVETTLVDLVALALGANRDAAQIAQMRGLRAARLREILAAIQGGFAEPDFAVRGVARKVGVSPRYVNDLLHETGVSLAERVLELRLQKARTMLADPRHDRLKIVEIAYGCGFNEVSYFNRCFRRRFGASPRQYRGGPNDRA
jgi:AraC-like DNA-binding protein